MIEVSSIKPGTKLKVTRESIKNGFPIAVNYAKRWLKEGRIYTVKDVISHGWYTNIELEEHKTKLFHSTVFELIEIEIETEIVNLKDIN